LSAAARTRFHLDNPAPLPTHACHYKLVGIPGRERPGPKLADFVPGINPARTRGSAWPDLSSGGGALLFGGRTE